MNLQFADFDADGRQDIIAATYEGHAFVVRGGADGWSAPEHIKDAQGRDVALSFYYDIEEREYRNVDRSPDGKTNAPDHCVSAMVMDWDADGDLDLLLGAKEGRLYLQRNEGTAAEPKFTGVNELLEAGGKPFNVPGGLTAARIVDWDGDGLRDLVCGSFGGGAYLYRNTGAGDAPVFASPVELAAAPEPSNDGEAGPTKDWYIDVVDYDGDGQLDLLVGGHYLHAPEARTLTAEEAARLAELDEASTKVSAEMNEFFAATSKDVAELPEEEQDAARDRIFAGAEYKEIFERMQSIRGEIAELRPRSKRVSGVWLYRGLPRG